MARFKYVAKDMSGKIHKGTVEAASENALTQQLREENLYLVEAKDLNGAKKHKKLKAKQLAAFCRELSTLLASGVTLVRALDIISEQEGINKDERDIYKDVLQDLKRGISLSDAMESKECFPDLMIGMIRSGEGSGNLDLVTQRLSIQYEKDYKLTQQVKSAMTYPCILLVLCVVIVILIVTFILPQFQSLFDQMESLPMITNILIAVSNFLVQKWYIALLIVAVIVALIRIIVGIPSVRRSVDWMKVHMWGFGKLFKVVYTARFARTLSSLYSSGMPLVSAVGVAAKTIGNGYVESQFDEVITMVRGGVPLSQGLREVDGLLKKLSSTILVGEESGRLDVMLDSIAETLEADAEQATKRMVTLLEPILIIFMALIVGCIMIGVMLPIYQSYSAIENA
ncbi:type II secretion system F family protein [Dorea formicigenerans]|uniref:Type II secretion system F family protein n=1 Tax=Dorea formicigenerans TaxID=39486 RepID=A0A413SHV8_9FIRM|nr:type II secretion system F family protein [Dorea formicigenerans]RGS70410.1 type II secretion system F family protein [Dorea formicigenerans]RHA67053.1 type II secretion system F family protein [Dorea formicigenerans]